MFVTFRAKLTHQKGIGGDVNDEHQRKLYQKVVAGRGYHQSEQEHEQRHEDGKPQRLEDEPAEFTGRYFPRFGERFSVVFAFFGRFGHTSIVKTFGALPSFGERVAAKLGL